MLLDVLEVNTLQEFSNLPKMGVWSSKEAYQSIADKDLEQPLIKWQVATSHNSFMKNVQHLAPALSENVALSIRSGARYIMLDVYRICDKLMVAHGDGTRIVTTYPVPLGECLDVLLKEAFLYTQDPLLLNFELALDQAYYKDVSEAVTAKLGDKLLKQADLGEKSLLETPIGQLKGKIIVVGPGLDISLTNGLKYKNYSSNAFNEAQTNGTLDTKETYVVTYQSDNLGAAFGLNYNPEPFLKSGAQAVSMNVLVDDEAMSFYKGWFRGHGFVLKEEPILSQPEPEENTETLAEASSGTSTDASTDAGTEATAEAAVKEPGAEATAESSTEASVEKTEESSEVTKEKAPERMPLLRKSSALRLQKARRNGRK